MPNKLIALLDLTRLPEVVGTISRLNLASVILEVGHLALARPGGHHDALVHDHAVAVADVVEHDGCPFVLLDQLGDREVTHHAAGRVDGVVQAGVVGEVGGQLSEAGAHLLGDGVAPGQGRVEGDLFGFKADGSHRFDFGVEFV